MDDLTASLPIVGFVTFFLLVVILSGMAERRFLASAYEDLDE